MSRIAGLVQPGGAQVDQLNTALLAVVGQGLHTSLWTRHVVSVGDCHLGWTGWRGDPLARQHGVVLLLDGHIYNDSDLIQRGTVDRGPTYLIGLYLEYGFPGMLNRLNGDFVIALHDKTAGELFIGRDRFGVKPLYYAARQNYFCFASRCASLFALGIEAQPDPAFIGRFAGTHYRYIDNVPDRSPYLGIRQLPAAHYLRVKTGESGKAASLVEIKSWWALGEESDFESAAAREAELAENYRDLLFDAVKIRLAKAARPAFTLSGGMDSSSVLALAVRNTSRKFHAFSTLYEDKTYDESDEIQSMLDATVEEWHPVHIGSPEVFGLISRMITEHDEPVATATWLSHFLLCETVAQQNFGSLFGGLGGDEINAGEYEYFFFHFADLKRSGREELYAYEVAKWCEYHDHPIFRKSPEVAAEALRRMVDLSSAWHCLPDRSRMFRYAQALNPEFFDETFQPRMEQPFSSYLKNRTYQDLCFETAPCCLRAEDRQATAYGLDNFLPFFDHRLAEFMFRVPGTLKIRGGVTKILLREAMKGVLPEETRTRIKKTGWNAPAHIWFSGKGREFLLDMVGSCGFRQRGIYRVDEVERIIREHDDIVSSGAQQDNHMMFLWQLVNLEIWLSMVDRQFSPRVT